MRLLLIEDDMMIAQAVSGSLKDKGFSTDHIRNGTQAATALRAQSYDLILLDLGLPGCDGLEVLRHIRHSGNPIPVLILTARDDIDSRLSGLDGGADDYLVKPFDIAELHARIRAILRRHHRHSSPQPDNGSLRLDTNSQQVYIRGHIEPIQLSHKEFMVLNALLLRPGVIHSRADLEDKLYAWGNEVESNAVDYLIHALRKKIGKEHIKNIRGAGWLVSKT